MRLTNIELEIMEIMWSQGQPLSRPDIVRFSDNKWPPTSVSARINSLLAKKMIAVSGFFMNGKKQGRLFEPTMSKEEYLISQIKNEKPNLAKIVTAFLDSDEYDKSAIQELEELLQRKKAEWGIDD